METAAELDITKPHCNFTIESEYRESMQKLMANHKAPENKLSQSQILIRVWNDFDKQKEKLNQETFITTEVEKAQYIKQLVAAFGGFDPTDTNFILGRKNANYTLGETKRYTDCRHVGMYITKMHTKLTLKQIGFIFFKKDHSTVLNAIKKVEGFISIKEKYVTEMIKFVEEKLKNANYIEQ